MNPFLWLLFILAVVLLLAVVAVIALAIVKAWRDLRTSGPAGRISVNVVGPSSPSSEPLVGAIERAKRNL